MSYRPGQSRPRCTRCHGEIRPLKDGNRLVQWEHVMPPANLHVAIEDVGILLPRGDIAGHKEEIYEPTQRELLRRDRAPEGYPGTTGKVLPEDWEYS